MAMTAKQKQNLLIAGAVGIGIYLWYTWKNGTGLFAPASPAGSSTTAVNTSALPSTQVSSGPDISSTSPTTGGVPVLLQSGTVSVNGVGRRPLSNII